MFTHHIKPYLHHDKGMWEHGSLYTGEGVYQQAEWRKGTDLLLSLIQAGIVSVQRQYCLSAPAVQQLDDSNSRFLEAINKVVEENLESRGKKK